jgi:TRAP-type C4-dicarboxylate transport system permease small subunit
MGAAYRRAMDALYFACVLVAGTGIVVIALVIPWGVYTRYVLDRGSAWPEPLSILLMIAFTFAGAAAVYRANAHIAVQIATERLPAPARRPMALAVETLMALLAIFMVIWGIELVQLTWRQVIAEFPFLSVGVTYLPIPIGGAATLCFILERLWLGVPPPDSAIWREPGERR